MFKKVLIANRGEIACRIMATCKALGVRTVAVYSEADQSALHVKLADEAIFIGGAPAAESYLDYKKIIAAAQKTGAEAVHPGYGFLSENMAFAKACKKHGLVFIGPPAAAIDAMGDKAKAKALMEKANVPVVPGAYGAGLTQKALKKSAKKIGYPVLLKAVAGGGGKGMRVVETPQEFDDAYAAASREGASSFGNDALMVEKYLAKPRHVEVQIFADSHGNCVHLFERDCSLQRRHQKVVEEAPAPHMPEALRQEMGLAAVRAAQAVNYVGAGTVEFLLEGESFYFMEMNTRLQVEHPVTEAVVDLDLVAFQLDVAAGKPFPFAQSDLYINGHAIEVRLYAEDPAQNFMPSTGTLVHCVLPEENRNIRVDSGVIAGDTISHYYDPMIAKIISWGENRAAALNHLQTALSQTQIVGVTTNLGYLKRILQHASFIKGNVHTKLLEVEKSTLQMPTKLAPELLVLGALYQAEKRVQNQTPLQNDPFSLWQNTRNWRLGGAEPETFVFDEGQVQLTATKGGWLADDMGFVMADLHQDVVEAQVDGVCHWATVIEDDGALYVFAGGLSGVLHIDKGPEDDAEADVLGKLTAPLPGKIVKVLVKKGHKAQKGESLVILEAMKTEHHITAPADGIVDDVFFAEGESVDKDTILVGFTPKKADAS